MPKGKTLSRGVSISIVPVVLTLCLCTCVSAHAQTSVPSAAEGSGSLALRSPGFEELEADGKPVGWRLSADSSGRISIGVDASVSHSGGHSLRIQVAPTDDPDAGVVHAGFSQMMDVEPHRYYLLGCWMKGEGAFGWPGARIYSEFGGKMQSGPDHTGDHDWKPVDVCVYSGDAERIPVSGYAYLRRGTVWFDDFTVSELDEAELGDWTPRDMRSRTLSASEMARGYAVFTAPTVERIYHTREPGTWEMTDTLRLQAARNQKASANLLIRNIGKATTARITPGELVSGKHRLPADRVRCRIVEPYRYMLDAYRWISVPLFLRNRDGFELPAGHTVQVYTTINVAEDTPPGEYRGTLRLDVSGRPTKNVTLRLRVSPLTLGRPGICFFQYYASPYVFDAYRGADYQRKYFRNMAEHGFTGVTLYNHSEFPDGAGGWAVDVDRQAEGNPASLADSMQAAMDAGLLGPDAPLVYLSCYHGTQHPERRHSFGSFLGGGASVLALEAERKKRGWPEFLYYILDEPGDEARNREVRAIYGRVYDGLPVRTTTAIGRLGIERVGDVYDVWIASWSQMGDDLAEEAARRGKQLWTYECWGMGQLPEMARFFAGYWSHRCGVRGNADWVYISNARRGKETVYPRLSSDGEYLHTDNWQFGYVLPAPSGPIDTIGLELRREGIDDFRYCELLDTFIAEHSGAGDARTVGALRKAYAVRQQLHERFDPSAFSDMSSGYIWVHGYRPQPELGLQTYDRLREEIVNACEGLALK